MPGWRSCAPRSGPTAGTARPSASATTTGSRASSRDCSPAATGGVGRVIRAVWADGGRFDGWSEHFSFARWMACAEQALAGEPVDVDWYTTRERDYAEVLPWDHLDAGLDREWLWEDWQDALSEVEVDDCRWTPCFDCGVCPQLGTEIQVGPTGKKLLPLTVVPVEELMPRTPDGPPPAPVVQRLRIRYAKRGRLRFSSHRDFQRALERALRRAAVPMAYSAGFQPAPADLVRRRGTHGVGK